MTIPAPSVSRRLFLGGSLSAIVLGGLAACSGANEPAPTPEPSAAAAFPVTVSHRYGETTIKAAPQRIVVVGFTEQDTLLALGITPIATTTATWAGSDEEYNVYPWAKDKLGDAKPAVLDSTEGLQLDQIKALKPDLILGTTAGLDQDAYTELSKIAPTIANTGASGSDSYEPWDTQTEIIGEAVGKAPEAKKLIADLNQRFADAKVAHPQFQGVTAAFVQAPYTDGSVIAWPAGLSSDFLTDLGFVIPESLDKFVSEEALQAEIPAEDTKVLDDAKILVWGNEDSQDEADIRADKVLSKLEAMKEGRVIFTGSMVTTAIYFSTILSVPYVLDAVVPELERVVPA
ncbi:MAG: ABC transporter substrate-binding protein [Microlunatus sp.]